MKNNKTTSRTVTPVPIHACRSLCSLAVLLALLLPALARAEGVVQLGFGQSLLDYQMSLDDGYATDAASASLYVDILTAGEVINVSLCGSSNSDALSVEIYAPSDDINAAQTVVLPGSNVDCADPMNAPLSNPIRHVTAESGTYRLVLQNTSQSAFAGSRFARYDITVTPDNLTDPDPTLADGRLWGYTYAFNAGGFGAGNATDANYYALIPGGRPNTDYVWMLDLNNFAGYGYNIVANSLGLDAPNSGYSDVRTGNTVSYQHPLYLGYPAIANPRPVNAPQLSGVRFIDDANEDFGITPGVTTGVQDSGTFEFVTDVEGTYSIRIDLNGDGIYGNAGDRQLLGTATVGLNQVAWDGRDANGAVPLTDTYYAQVQVHMGEYHFIANDVETSGGGTNDGLTVFLANSDDTTDPTRVYWDDVTLLGSGGTSNMPDGAMSDTPAGRHTWGNFTSSGFGNERYIDTYVYGLETTAYSPAAIVSNDTPLVSFDGVLSTDAELVAGAALALSVSDADLNEDPGLIEDVEVVVVNDITGEQETVLLIETGANTGVFSATLSTQAGSSAGSDDDGTLVVQSPHTLTVTYLDLIAADYTSTERTAAVAVVLDSDGDGLSDANDPDDDNDGIPDVLEGSGDDDGDGIANSLDTDSDGDGIPDATEAALAVAVVALLTGNDADSDGIDDALDVDVTGGTDADGNGIDDAREPVDTDGDVLPDYLDIDSDGDGIADVLEDTTDSDGDGLADYRDTDSDNDGIADADEDGQSPALLGTDADNDGIDDAIDVDLVGGADVNGNGIADAVEPSDTDSDGTPDYRDIDSDGDGIADVIEGNGDTDGDGLADARDTDSDNDGILDSVEDSDSPALIGTDADNDGIDDAIDVDATGGSDTNGNGIDDALEPSDTDSDGVPDYRDLDSDNDAIVDRVEGTADADSDGTPNYRDTDADGDGINDTVEGGITVAVNGADSDGDGLPDSIDVDATGGTDGDGDGVDDALAPLDTDSDGNADYLDLDADADGIADAVEGTVDTDSDGTADFRDLDSDADGLSDAVEGAGDTDGDLLADYRDGDSDGDGIADVIEGSDDTDGDGQRDSLDLDADGDGLADSLEGNVDTDGDGVSDFRDLDSDDDGVADADESISDSDGDGTPDFRDDDSDNDGISDALEGGVDTDGDGLDDSLDTDSDNDGIPDSVEGAIDSDGDGLVDFRDLDSDNDGLTDRLETAMDTDADGIADFRDLDSDNDGISDFVESGASAALDVDGDARHDGPFGGNGLADAVETATESGLGDPDGDGVTSTARDSDGDGVADFRDLDSDNDSRTDVREAGGTDSDGDGERDGFVDGNNDGLDDALASVAPGLPDTDGDSLPDYLDLDSDGDGLADILEEGLPDVDADGQVDDFNDGDGDGYDDDLSVTAFTPRDTDGDGIDDAIDDDSDNDGLPDTAEGSGDSDGDGIADRLDTDSDNDGIPDAIEGLGDTDGDGIPDAIDTDSDGDGIPDAAEAGSTPSAPVDTDNDGTPDYLDLDTDDDGIADSVEGSVDADGDGTGNYRDTDADGDGITDRTEGERDTDSDLLPDYLDPDADGDGLPDSLEGETDTDSDGTPDYRDLDADDDGIADAIEGSIDTDGDGTANFRDLDSDDDGIDDQIEGIVDSDGDTIVDALDPDSNNDGLADALVGAGDTDADGTPDYLDPDIDGDGLPNNRETDSGLDVDTDGDGVPDALDLDSDNDGVDDAIEFGPDPENPRDSDGDGIIDALDIDSDNDGIPDAIERGTGVYPRDADRDGVPDMRDLDSDNDGIVDTLEAYGVDDDGDGQLDGFVDANGNGMHDAAEADPLAIDDFDADGVPDILDHDSDNDGLTDTLEAAGAELDTDRDGMIDNFTDANGNGLDDSLESALTRIVPDDVDGDSMPDHLDIDTDNDGILDLVEAGQTDADGDGVVDSMADADADGIPDLVDVDVTLGADADGDGIDDTADADFLPGSTDTDGDGIVDERDPDIDGDGMANPLSDDVVNGASGDLPDVDQDGLPDVEEPNAAGFVHTGLSGGGCSVLGTSGRTADPALALLAMLAGLALVRRRRSAVRARLLRTGSVALAAMTLAGSVHASETVAADTDELEQAPAAEALIERDGEQANAQTDEQADRLRRRQFYAGFGFGVSRLEPDTDDVDGVDVSSDASNGTQLMLGWDVNKWYSLELHAATLGEAGLSNDAEIGYNEVGLSALLYAGKARHRDKRHGLTAFARVGVGSLSNSVSGDVEVEKDNAAHLLFGGGIEWMSRRGVGLRAEATSFDTDVQYAQLGLIYRFGKGREREDVIEEDTDVATLAPAAEAPVTDVAVAPTGPDADDDGVADALDQCPGSAPGAAVDDQGCVLFAGTIRGVNFLSGSATLTREAQAALDQVVTVLQQHETLDFELSAHTDSLGDSDANMALSRQRALSVARYLLERGVAKQRFTVRAFGENRPIDSNETVEGRRNNRRVELVLIR